MKDVHDSVTSDMHDQPKKKRGRPATGSALSGAERNARYLANLGGRRMTVTLSKETHAALSEYLERRQTTLSEVVERLIQSQIMRRR